MVRTKDETCPVSLDEIKEWNYIEDHVFDNKLRLCIEAAISAVESYINQVVWPSTFVFELPVPLCVLEIPIYPVSSIQVSVGDADIPADRYAWDGRVLRIDGPLGEGKMTVTVQAGNATLEQDVKSAILLIASELFRNPTDSVKTLPTTSKLLLDPHRNANI